MDHNLQIVAILTVGFTLASLFGYFAQRLRLSPILGYLLAGYLIGPFSPGFTADMSTAEQLAEVGVILMLFGVGMHFKIKDLMAVRKIAIPGALIQTGSVTIFGTFLIYMLGWSFSNGLVIGLAISVASTVILVKMLSDNKLLETSHGHISVGWLIVEDIITVSVLILLPMLAIIDSGGSVPLTELVGSIGWMIVKLALLAIIMFTWGQKFVTYTLNSIARLRSPELFTLTVIALIFLIAAGSTFVFGTSIALGAFISGMVIGRTDVRDQATNDSLPLKDLFCVIFFLSVGMLFNPSVIFKEFPLFAVITAIILILKPVVAFAVVILLKFPLKTALVAAVALAQIGEFSFILAQEAMRLKLLPETGYDLLVACALLSIIINPLLFKALGWLEKTIISKDYKIFRAIKDDKEIELAKQEEWNNKVAIIGFGPTGRMIAKNLEEKNISFLVIEQNIDTVIEVKSQNHRVIYGDASQPNILKAAKIEKAEYLIITIPDISATCSTIKAALSINPAIKILSRVNYISDEIFMKDTGVEFICTEKESMTAFAKLIDIHIKLT